MWQTNNSRLDSKTNSVTSNNTYLNNFKTLNKLLRKWITLKYKIVYLHRLGKKGYFKLMGENKAKC